MKIRDILNEAGLLKSIAKGAARAIAPNTVRDYELRKRLQLMPTPQQPDVQPGLQPTQPAVKTAPAARPTASMVGKYGNRPAAPQAYQSAMGVAVKQANDSGIVLVYGKNNYMLNSQGEWAVNGKDSAGAVASEPLQAEMDKVAKSTGYM